MMALQHGRTIRTAGKRTLRLTEPDPSAIHIRDIARGLANTCRFSGQLPTFYSVAQHSVLASEFIAGVVGSKMLSLHVLLHDAAEAYITDLPRPLKEDMPPEVRAWWVSLEDRLMTAIYQSLDIPRPIASERALIQQADETMLVTEDWHLRHLVQFKEARPLDQPIIPWEPTDAENAFLDSYAHLRDPSP